MHCEARRDRSRPLIRSSLLPPLGTTFVPHSLALSRDGYSFWAEMAGSMYRREPLWKTSGLLTDSL
jgi:hypothetical protein